MRRPLCFVLMPFQQARPVLDGRLIDFDAIYSRIIEPAVFDAGLRPHRADEETLGGIFHKHMFERLALCEYAVADLTLANPNVFYELGVRHAIRPWSTVLMFCNQTPLPLDVASSSALPYQADVDDRPDEIEHLRARLTRRMRRAQDRMTDSPVHQLVAGLPTPELDHRRVDLVLEAIDRENELSRQVTEAGEAGLEHLRALRTSLGPVGDHNSESVVTLLLAFRRLNAWDDMRSLVNEMPLELAEVWLVREQYALALGRLGEYRKAVEILKDLLNRRPNAETYGLLGGTYKREWRETAARGQRILAEGLLLKAANTYRLGFERDLRDPYPGVNAVTLLYLAGRHVEADELAPVVRYCVNRRLQADEPEYWDYACALELALVRGDREGALAILPELLTTMAEPFQCQSTTETLALLEGAKGLSLDLEFISEVRQAIQDRREQL